MSGEETLTYSGQGEMTVKEVKVKIGSLLSQGKVSDGHQKYFSEFIQIFYLDVSGGSALHHARPGHRHEAQVCQHGQGELTFY